MNLWKGNVGLTEVFMTHKTLNTEIPVKVSIQKSFSWRSQDRLKKKKKKLGKQKNIFFDLFL